MAVPIKSQSLIRYTGGYRSHIQRHRCYRSPLVVNRWVGVVEGDRLAVREEPRVVPVAVVVGRIVADNTDSMQHNFDTLHMRRMGLDRRNIEHIARRSLMRSQLLGVPDW